MTKIYYIKLTKDVSPHKYKAVVYDEDMKKLKTIHFGYAGMSDYTILSLTNVKEANERKNRYINRHKSRENWNNLLTAGFYSRWILWNKKTIQESKRDTENRFGIKFI